jgi:hypothetical protein
VVRYVPPHDATHSTDAPPPQAPVPTAGCADAHQNTRPTAGEAVTSGPRPAHTAGGQALSRCPATRPNRKSRGGKENKATGEAASIGGGGGGEASAPLTSVTGGRLGKAPYRASTALGGLGEVSEAEFGVAP